MGDAAHEADRKTEGQREPCTRLICKQCVVEFQPRNRNGVKAAFCSTKCRTDWHNAQRLKGAALLRAKSPRRRGPSKRAQAVSRAIFLARVPIEQRPALLLEAARRLWLTEEGPVLTAARRAAQNLEPRTSHQEVSA